MGPIGGVYEALYEGLYQALYGALFEALYEALYQVLVRSSKKGKIVSARKHVRRSSPGADSAALRCQEALP